MKKAKRLKIDDGWIEITVDSDFVVIRKLHKRNESIRFRMTLIRDMIFALVSIASSNVDPKL